jgi:hypothetical protein
VTGFGKNVPEQWEQPVLRVYLPPYRSSRAGGLFNFSSLAVKPPENRSSWGLFIYFSSLYIFKPNTKTIPRYGMVCKKPRVFFKPGGMHVDLYRMAEECAHVRS